MNTYDALGFALRKLGPLRERVADGPVPNDYVRQRRASALAQYDAAIETLSALRELVKDNADAARR